MANKPLTVLARIKAKPGKERDLKAALERLKKMLEHEGGYRICVTEQVA